MSDVPDFRGQVERNQPTDFLHKIMNAIPGYTGYADRERRRDADKMLRTYLARQYRDQLSRLGRLEGALATTQHAAALPELQRLEGMLNRFIDKLDTATYGYAGLFDATKVTETELNQLYVFDQNLAEGAHQLAGDIDALDAATHQGAGVPPGGAAAAPPDLGSGITRLSTTIDNLLQTWNHRTDVLTSGQPLPPAEFARYSGPGTAAPSTGAPGPGPGMPGPGMPGPGPGMPGPGPGMPGPGMGTSSAGAETTRLSPGVMPPLPDSGPPDMGGLSGPDDMSAAATGGWHPDDIAAGASGGGPSGAGTDFASMPGGANTGGNVGAQPGQPLVGGGESFGSPATTGGANPDTAAQAQTPGGADVSPSPDAASSDHSTMGTSGNT